MSKRKASVATPKDQPVKINAKYKCTPQNGHVHVNGTVTFTVAPSGGCMIFTVPANAFVNETNGSVQLAPGNGSGNTLTTNVPAGTTIAYCACAINQTCNPSGGRMHTGPNTIKVESQ
jgi:hypothetical protein